MAAKDQDAKADELRQLFAELKTAYARFARLAEAVLLVIDQDAFAYRNDE